MIVYNEVNDKKELISYYMEGLLFLQTYNYLKYLFNSTLTVDFRDYLLVELPDAVFAM